MWVLGFETKLLISFENLNMDGKKYTIFFNETELNLFLTSIYVSRQIKIL